MHTGTHREARSEPTVLFYSSLNALIQLPAPQATWRERRQTAATPTPTPLLYTHSAVVAAQLKLLAGAVVRVTIGTSAASPIVYTGASGIQVSMAVAVAVGGASRPGVQHSKQWHAVWVCMCEASPGWHAGQSAVWQQGQAAKPAAHQSLTQQPKPHAAQVLVVGAPVSQVTWEQFQATTNSRCPMQ